MREGGWNHNIHYHGLVLDAVPAQCQLSLDVGCGSGGLAKKLTARSARVIGIDCDQQSLTMAKTGMAAETNLGFVEGDVLTYPFEPRSFDFISAIASLHHLPLDAALERFALLLKPGGVLCIVGLYRSSTLAGTLCSVAAWPVSKGLRAWHGEAEVGAPLAEPGVTLREYRNSFGRSLPGGVCRRLFFFRYSYVWVKPAGR